MIQIGDLDLVSNAIETERRLLVLEQTIHHLLKTNPSIKGITKFDMDGFNKEAILILQKKYPNLGISQNN